MKHNSRRKSLIGWSNDVCRLAEGWDVFFHVRGDWSVLVKGRGVIATRIPTRRRAKKIALHTVGR